jgi:hypothetical protein
MDEMMGMPTYIPKSLRQANVPVAPPPSMIECLACGGWFVLGPENFGCPACHWQRDNEKEDKRP